MKTSLGASKISLQSSGVQFADVSDIAVDSADNLYLLTRQRGAVLVYGADGRFLRAWGVDRFALPHGITIDGDDKVFVVDQGAHAVFIFTTTGDEIGVIGTPGAPSDTGVDWNLPTYKERYLSTTRGGPPFNNPTKLALAPDGSMYVSDGYGNARVHRFTADGELLQSWGQPGSQPGQFRLVHSVCVLDDGRVLVCDRENDRIQSFTPDGELLDVWSSVQRPTAVVPGPEGTLVVAELGWKRGDHSFVTGEVTDPLPGGVSVLDSAGRLLARFQDGEITRPHGLGRSGEGTIYVAQLGTSTVTTLEWHGNR